MTRHSCATLAQPPSLMAAAHPNDLYPLIVSFLQKQGLAAAATVVKEAAKRTQVRADALPLRTCVAMHALVMPRMNAVRRPNELAELRATSALPPATQSRQPSVATDADLFTIYKAFVQQQPG